MAAQSKLITNFAGSTTKSNIAKVGLGYSLNMYPETQSTEHSCTILMRPTSGAVLACELQGQCRGMYRVSRAYDENPGLYAVFGHDLWYIDSSNTYHAIGKIDSDGTKCNMCETGGYGSAHPHLIITDGTHVYAVNTGLPLADQAREFAEHGNIQLPLRVNSTTDYIKPTHCAYLFGYLIVNDAGTDAFYTSYQYPFETYTEADPEYWDIFRVKTTEFKDYGFITYSEWQPDATLALCSNGSKLYTFGTRSWQAFSYNNDVNNPFSSPDNAAGNVGIKAPNSLAMLGNTVLFLGSSDIGDNGVFMIKDSQITRVSTNDIEREINLLSDKENAYSSIWQEHQHLFYSLTFEASKTTYVYDISEGAWHNRSSFDESNKQTYWRYNNATFAYGKIYVGTNDALCYLDENVYTEHNGMPILKLRRGSVLTNDGRPFYIDAAEIITNNGQHSLNNTYGDLELNPRVTIRFSWDGATWSDYEDNYLGKIGQYGYRTIYDHLGLGRYFTLEISTTENIPFCIENLKIKYTPSSSF